MAQGSSGTGTSTGAEHKCGNCGKSFNSASELREHEKTCKASGLQRR